MESDDENLIEEWFLKRNISSGTQIAYKRSLKLYTGIINKEVHELIEEAEKQEVKGILFRKRNINIYLLKYRKYLENSELAPSTSNLYFYAIKSFYKAFHIFLPEIEIPKGDIGLDKNIGKPLTRKDIHKLISVSPPRERALIYLMTLSGMGQREARDLTLRKLLSFASSAIEKDLDDVYDLFKFEDELLKEILTLDITRSKSKIRHHTFMPPECTREVITYLKERCYGRNKKIRIKNNDDTVFVSNYGSRLSRDSVVTNFRRMGEKAGFKREKGTYSFWRAHSLRKYFISIIINKMREKIFADYMVGHKINDQDRTYWKADPADLKKHYLEVLPYLSLDKAKVKDVESKEFKEYIEKSREKDEVVSALVKEMAEMKERNQARDKFLDKILNNQNVIEELEELDKLDTNISSN
ncbi:tyrosine-type recombinase/integrase [Methanobacterium spitsbergense]|uniref:Tyrosine-type recombinase/integrase n=1 Tax=Methanobacterium spitsbergense TaxID=2874285 RepID=A0A8T5ULD0_9EURY|nr:tyrosine-type recombinase/integrase [Methanobacterium spitsbergense]MBZ2164494.1 tyrosine-type recombinase/integrase [Methanobacterium spitsbergense]